MISLRALPLFTRISLKAGVGIKIWSPRPLRSDNRNSTRALASGIGCFEWGTNINVKKVVSKPTILLFAVPDFSHLEEWILQRKQPIIRYGAQCGHGIRQVGGVQGFESLNIEKL